jgi:rare lipoprotein A
VTSVANGRSVVVRVNDRGPFHASRIIDLSYAAAYRLGFVQAGSAQVEVEVIVPGREVPSGVYVQVGAFSARENAQSLHARLRRELAWLEEAAEVLLSAGYGGCRSGPMLRTRPRAPSPPASRPSSA